jgi:hypothetical protein
VLSQQSDFGLLEGFKCIDTENRGFIDPVALSRFYDRLNVRMLGDHMAAILRRIDLDGDGQISYPEFVDCLIPSKATYASVSQLASTSPARERPALAAGKIVRQSRSGTGSTRRSPLRRSP